MPVAPPDATPDDAAKPRLRIGELARRVGVSATTLRAWERRYGVLRPERSDSGYRLYTATDEATIRALMRLRSEGVATAEAARLAREDPPLEGQAGHGTATAGRSAPLDEGADVVRSAPSEADVGAEAPTSLRRPVTSDRVERLVAACEAFDGAGAHAVLDRAVGDLTVSTLIEELVLPAMRSLGDRWERGEVSPAQEHFASELIRGRMIGLGRGWGSGAGPAALLACPPGERHDLGLVAFAILLREQGWRIVFLGHDTPSDSLAGTAAALMPAATVVAGIEARRLRAVAAELGSLAREYPLWIAGPAASGRLAKRIGAHHLEGEPSNAARELSARLAAA